MCIQVSNSVLKGLDLGISGLAGSDLLTFLNNIEISIVNYTRLTK